MEPIVYSTKMFTGSTVSNENRKTGGSQSFLCRTCGGNTQVLDSRALGGGHEGIRRRRGCIVCRATFSTVEIHIDKLTGLEAERQSTDEVAAAIKTILNNGFNPGT